MPHVIKEPYSVSFHFTNDDDVPYVNTSYIAILENGADVKGQTDEDSYTETYEIKSSSIVTSKYETSVTVKNGSRGIHYTF